MRNITLNKNDIYVGNLILVNADYPIVNEKNTDLITANDACVDIFLKKEAATVLSHILKDIHSGENIVPVSGYRSKEEQTEIYSSTLKESGKSFCKKFVALPGHSEHQTGLAIDLGIKKDVIDFIRPDFPYTGICEKFRKKAVEYGFVERYQTGKEKITGISHEPWHFRYVGYPHSQIMTCNNMSLEEYIQYLKTFSYQKSHLLSKVSSTDIEIFYLPISNDCTADFCIPENALYKISGNNSDGCIVTVWR